MADKKTLEEIARQFELPERRSKIATLLKQDGQEYCICRSSDSSRFMISCDYCEEWFHGDCIGISKKEAKYIKNYYCERCQQEDPSLVIIQKSHKSKYEVDEPYELPLPKTQSRSKTKIVESKPKKIKTTSTKSGGCGDCSNCRRTANCGTCRACKETRKPGRKAKEKCLNRVCRKKKFGTKRKDDSSSDEEVLAGSALKSGMQCYGPGCMYAALPNTKYCSEECGIKLATNRIFQVLPQRLQEWSLTPPYAEERDKRELEVIREKLEQARAKLQALDKDYENLEELIRRGKSIVVDFDEDNLNSQYKKFSKNRKKEMEEDSSIYCVTCGHEIHTSSAIKHMEKCFNKYESQASFGSVFKTRIEGYNMFCDFYNPANMTYCKRLRVLCPEHQKDPVISPNEICGFPFVRNVFEETGEICMESKKICLRHHCWEKLRRAEIDTERVRQWLKIDELLEQERQVKQKLSQRAGVLGLMLHSTYDHEHMERMSSKQEEERLAQLEKNLRENYNKEQFENIKVTSKNKKILKVISQQQRS